LREGSSILEGVDPKRVVFIARTFIAPPERDEPELPATQEPTISDDSRSRQERRQPLDCPQ
jgi:hypothetical protein